MLTLVHAEIGVAFLCVCVLAVRPEVSALAHATQTDRLALAGTLMPRSACKYICGENEIAKCSERGGCLCEAPACSIRLSESTFLRTNTFHLAEK